jgi:hypothetical protein
VVVKNSVLAALIIAMVFCGLLSDFGSSQGQTSQGETSGTQMETQTIPPDFRVWVSPAEVSANAGDQIEICCNISQQVYTPVEVTSVDVVLFDSYDSVIREQAMNTWYPDDGYHLRSASTVYTIVGDEAYYKLKINFCHISISSYRRSGNYTDYTDDSFPIIVNAEWS